MNNWDCVLSVCIGFVLCKLCDIAYDFYLFNTYGEGDDE